MKRVLLSFCLLFVLLAITGGQEIVLLSSEKIVLILENGAWEELSQDDHIIAVREEYILLRSNGTWMLLSGIDPNIPISGRWIPYQKMTKENYTLFKEIESGTIKIALQAPITGDYAYEGQMAKQSVEVAAELINKAGGVLGKQVEIVIVDDGSNPKDSALAAQKAVSQKVVAVIGSYGSSVTEPAADIYEKNKIVSIAYGATALRLTMDKDRQFFFRTCGRDDAQGLFFGKYAVETLGAKRIAIMHDNSTFAKGVADEAEKALAPYIAEGKTEIVYFDAITPKEKDFSSAVTNLRETKPDVWYFTGYYPEAGLLIRQARDAGLDCPFIGGNAAINDDFVKIAGINVAQGALMTQEPLVTDVTTSIAEQFKALYAEKFKELPSSPWPVYAADGLYAIVGAIGKAGKTDSAAIADALKTKMDGVEGVTGPVLFTERGDRRDVPFRMYQVELSGLLGLYKETLITSKINYWIQAGSFSVKFNADDLANRLKEMALSIIVVEKTIDKKVRYIINVGPYNSREEAASLLSKVKSVHGAV